MLRAAIEPHDVGAIIESRGGALTITLQAVMEG